MMFIISILSTISLVVLRYYNDTNHVGFLMTSFIAGVLITYLYLPIMKEPNSGVVCTNIKIISILMLLLFTRFVWKETLSIRQCFGVFAAIVSVFLLSK